MNIHPLFEKILEPIRPTTPKCSVCGAFMDFYGWRTVDHPAGEADLKQYECRNCGHINEVVS